MSVFVLPGSVRKFVVGIFVWIAVFAAQVEAAPVSARALAPLPSADISYFYLGLEDARSFTSRLNRSEVVRYMAELETSFFFVREILKDFPFDDMALMVSEKSFQMALKCDEAHRDILKKIAAHTATKEEILAIFGGKATFLGTIMSAYPPEEGVRPYYELAGYDIYFSAHDDILIFGTSTAAVKASLEAAKNSFKRFKLPHRGNARNSFYVGLSSEWTEELMETKKMMSGEESSLRKGKINFEGDFKLVPGGWDLELFSNAVSIAYGEDFEKNMYAKPAGSFFSAGGGELLLAFDSTPDVRQLMASSIYMRTLDSAFGGFFQAARDHMERTLGHARSEALLQALQAVDRINIAVTRSPSNYGDLRPYVALSGRDAKTMREAGDLLSKWVELYNEDEDSRYTFEKIQTDAWRTLYAMPLPEDGVIATQNDLTLAIGDDTLVAGVLAPSLLSEKFSSESELFKRTFNANLKEMVYLDVRALRKVAAAFTKNMQLSRQSRRMLASMLMPLVDIREISCETLSADHFVFRFKTGWLDFEDRDFLLKLFGRR